MPKATLNPSELVDWLRLIATDRVGPQTFFQLLSRHGSAAAALDALPALLPADIRVPTRAAGEAMLATATRIGAHLLAWGEPGYPECLAAIADAPPLVYCLGDSALLERRAVAVVGARNASASGCRFAHDIAHDLGGRGGLVVVSGLARGIDAAAHRGALPSGTVAVLAGGVDVPYPSENRELYAAILDRGGAILSELPPGTVPVARHFVRRNRIISGLSLGVVVVEAAFRSGSLTTARLAAEQGRDVFAVPGSPLDPRCRGTNDLIRHGATLTESADDVLPHLGNASAGLREWAAPLWRDPPPAPTGADEGTPAGVAAVMELLGYSPVPVDDVVRHCHLPASAVATILLDLELAGRIDRHPGQKVSLRTE